MAIKFRDTRDRGSLSSVLDSGDACVSAVCNGTIILAVALAITMSTRRTSIHVQVESVDGAHHGEHVRDESRRPMHRELSKIMVIPFFNQTE